METGLEKAVKAIKPPRGLLDRAEKYNRLFEELLGKKQDASPEKLDDAWGTLQDWLADDKNADYIVGLMKSTVEFIRGNENDVLAESHNIVHLSEMATCLLDDKARGVDTDRASAFITLALTLLHDLGRKTERLVVERPLEEKTDLHHDKLSYRAARKILQPVGESSEFPQEVKDAIETLIFKGLRHMGETDQRPYLALAPDFDRRQLTGAPTVVRDIPYFGGWQNTSLSLNEIKSWPTGYIYPYGFFSQQRIAGNIFRDAALRETRRLDEVYDRLSVEAATILLLACGGDEQMIQKVFDVELGLAETPKSGMTDEAGRRWWPKKRLPDGALGVAREEQRKVEEAITVKELSPQDLVKLVDSYLTAYTTFIDPLILANLRGNMEAVPANERIGWARILFYAHRKNQERYLARTAVLGDEEQRGTFLARILAPFMETFARKENDRAELKRLFLNYWPKVSRY